MTLRILRAVSDMALRTEAALRRCYTTLRRLGRRTSQHDHAAAELIAESELFDGDWYLAHYPEAASSGMQTALHYVCVGAAQGNDPGPSFSSNGYLARYPDVGAAGMNPLLHYLRFGSEEGRDIVAPGTSKRAAPTAVGPWDVPCEAPLAAPSPVRFSLEPWLAEPDGAARLPPDAQLDGIALSLSGVSLGFVGPGRRRELKIVAAFARLSGVDVAEALVVGDENAPGPEANSGTPGLDTMLSLGSATGFDFGDVWFINDRDLRARLNAPPGCVQRFVLTCYQFAPAMLPTQRPATQRRLLRLAEQAAPRGELDFADIATSNPYLPLLFTLTTAGGAMIAATLLPFPSLCRGGAHYGELLSASHGKDYLTALRAESHLLVEERLSDAGPPALARIEVDLRDATGAERIFSADLRSWIGQEGAGVTIAPAAPAHGSEGLAVRYLEESVTTPALAEPSATRPFTLRLPADAIPSLRVLVSRRLPWPHDGEQMVGAFVVVAQADGAPRWCIMPPAHADLVALQPEGGSGFPILLGSGSALRAPAADQRAAYPEPLLLALRFCDLSQPQTSRLVAPVAPEAPGPLLPAAGGDQRSQLSVLHHVSGSLAHLEAFLESLQRQRIAATPEVILVLADDRSDHAAIADDLVRRYFPKTGRLVRDPEPADRAERLEAAAATARGDFLLFVGDDVILHDARTLVTLLTLAHYERAASASCLMIATDPRQPMRMMLVSGGYYRHEVCSGSDATSINLDVCADLAALPPATWPVAASDPRISMVRGDIWRKLKGFSAAGQQAALDDGARAAMAGYSHYCTSVISVTLLGDVAGSSAMAAPPLSPGTRTGTVVRRLVA